MKFFRGFILILKLKPSWSRLWLGFEKRCASLELFLSFLFVLSLSVTLFFLYIAFSLSFPLLQFCIFLSLSFFFYCLQSLIIMLYSIFWAVSCSSLYSFIRFLLCFPCFPISMSYIPYLSVSFVSFFPFPCLSISLFLIPMQKQQTIRVLIWIILFLAEICISCNFESKKENVETKMYLLKSQTHMTGI